MVDTVLRIDGHFEISIWTLVDFLVKLSTRPPNESIAAVGGFRSLVFSFSNLVIHERLHFSTKIVPRRKKLYRIDPKRRWWTRGTGPRRRQWG